VIDAMQGATARSVGAIGGMSKTIQKLDQFSARIAQAVEERVRIFTDDIVALRAADR